MAQTRNFIAFDLGAESGRTIVGRFDGRRLTLDPLNRFTNGPVRIAGHMFWDELFLFSEMLAGLAAYSACRAVSMCRELRPEGDEQEEGSLREARSGSATEGLGGQDGT